jgi:hypothetical protein
MLNQRRASKRNNDIFGKKAAQNYLCLVLSLMYYFSDRASPSCCLVSDVKTRVSKRSDLSRVKVRSLKNLKNYPPKM